MEETKDFIGNKLRVGDPVIVQPPAYKGFRRDRVAEISPSGKTIITERSRNRMVTAMVLKEVLEDG